MKKHENIKCIFKDKEYIELLHLFKIRNNLVHLKPIEQLEEGDPQNKTCRSAMNYLYKNLKLIIVNYLVILFFLFYML